MGQDVENARSIHPRTAEYKPTPRAAAPYNAGMLIECVPNVSEGRQRGVIDAMSGAVARVPGVRLLDVSADPDHNRAVLTLAGGAPALESAMLALVGEAVAAIDLRQHRGVHPRIGAVDVIPFVPLDDTPMAACVALADTVGARIADRFAIPVFLYGRAARRPERRSLAAIRRGGFEQLAARLARPEWAPDFGPQRPHPTAGATAVGARPVLIAYNVTLETNRLEVARAIATAVRESNGGLAGVQAMGVPLAGRGIVQVSMNLTDYHQTAPLDAFAAVTREAARHGVTVRGSEIVGLAPAAAVTAEIARAIRLPFNPDGILERRLGRL